MIKHKLISLFVALVSAANLLAYDAYIDGIYYYFNSTDMTAEVTNETGSSSAKSYSGSITIPASVSYSGKTYSVTTIGNYAFNWCEGLTSVTIPNSVTSIGGSAFSYCSGLTSVTIPNSVTSIGDRAFSGCSGLTSITIPNSVTTIEYCAFAYCSKLTSITIPNSVTTIGDFAFCGCIRLTSVTISNSVTTIGRCAFYNCSGLTSIIVDAANTHYCSVDGVLFNYTKDTLIQYPIGNTRTEYTIPNSVTTIGDFAFYGCSKLTSVTIPNSVTTIGEDAFYGCKGLTSVTIPNTVTHMGSGVFSGSNLATLTCEAVTPPICSSSLGVSSSLVLYVPKNSVNQYKTATHWNVISDIRPIVCVVDSGECGDNLLWNLSCDSVLTIKGKGSMYDYGRDKYPWNDYMMAIKEVVLSEGITSIGSHAFFECENLVTIDLPKSLAMIGNYAFYNCYNLQSLFIPNQVDSIGEYAFWYCYGLKQISVDGLNTQYDSRENCNAIIETSTNKLILGCENSFIPTSVTIIGDRAFHYCLTLKAIDIPNNVTFIGVDAFWCCKNVQSVLIPNSVQRIGESAFQLCSSMTTLQIGENVTAIESKGFFQCSALRTITINALTPPILGKDVFDRCEIDSITLYVPAQSVVAYKEAEGWKDFIKIQPIGVTPNNVITYTASSQLSGYNGSLSVGATAFGPAITSHEFANGTGTITCSGEITKIGNSTFYLCEDLISIIIPNSVTTIGDEAFRGCDGLTSVTIPNSVVEINDYAFQYCDQLTMIDIPSNVSKLSAHTFDNCKSLKYIRVDANNAKYCSTDNVVFNITRDTLLFYPAGKEDTNYFVPEGVVNIGEWAFATSRFLKNIQLPHSLKSISDDAFRDCDSLLSITIPSNVKKIGWFAFGGCNSLQNVIIEDGVEFIDDDAFYICNKLSSINIPASVTYIGSTAFYRAHGLTNIQVDEANTHYRSVNGVLFTHNLDTLIQYPLGKTQTSYKIPDEVSYIDKNAFEDCEYLQSVELGSSVTTIGQYAFAYCRGLTSLTCEATTPPTCGYGCFYEVDTSIPLYVPAGSIEAYQEADEWKDFYDIRPIITDGTNVITYTATEKLTRYTLDAGETTFGSAITSHDFSNGTGTITCDGEVTTIGEWAFGWCPGLTSITIPNSVTTIGNYAFRDCDDLTSITIPNSVTTIGSSAFSGCTGLTSVTIGDSVTTIGNSAFDMCSGLISIDVDAANTHYASVDGVLFNYAKDTLIRYPMGNTRTTYTIPNSVTTIGEDAFHGCSGLTSVTIPNSVTTIGESAFYGCSGLTSITIPNSVKTIGRYAFGACFSLTSVTIPDSVTLLEEFAFDQCSNLTSITIGKSIPSIEQNTFDCRNLASITCYATTPPACLKNSFNYINKSIPIFVPAGSIVTYKQAEGWKEFTNIIGICEGDPYFSVQDTIICGRPYPFVWEGDTVRYGGEVWHWGNSWSWYNHVDTVTRNYISVGGCDSILQLVVYYPGYQYELINDTIEEGQSHWSGYTETGIYYKRYPNVYGCDSTVLELHLYVMPKPIYMVTISVNNAKYGSVEGAGTYNKGDTVILSATPNKGYQFNQWSDGNTDNPRTIYNIDKDYTLTAQFGIKQCSWLVESSDLEMGAVYTDFTNEYYNYGTQITVEASANSGYKFVKWNDGKKYNPYKFSILEDKYLLAIFIAEEEEADTTQVQPSDTTATFTWPFIVGGFTYTLTIYLDAACTIPFCTLTFNQYGQLTGITFGSRVPRRSAMANQEEEFTTTINGLSAGTEYFYKMETKDKDGKLLNTDEGGFSTQNSGVITNTEKVEVSIQGGKFIKDNQLYIFRGDKIYTATGQNVK